MDGFIPSQRLGGTVPPETFECVSILRRLTPDSRALLLETARALEGADLECDSLSRLQKLASKAVELQRRDPAAAAVIERLVDDALKA